MFNKEIKRIKAEKRQTQANGIILGIGIIGAGFCSSILLITLFNL